MNKNPSNQQHLDDLRMQINIIDVEIIALIANRHAVSRLISEYKLQHGLPVVNETREAELKLLHNSLSAKYNISIEYITELFDLIIKQSKEVQYQR